MSLHTALMNGWWNKLKAKKPENEITTRGIPAIFHRADTLSPRCCAPNHDKVLHLAGESGGEYLRKKGFSEGFSLPKKEVEAVRNASIISVGVSGEVKEATVVPETVTDNTDETVVVEPHMTTAVLKALRDPPYPNTSDTKKISTPQILEHMNRVYASAELNLANRRTIGGPGGEGGNGTKLLLHGTEVSIVDETHLPELQNIAKSLKSMKDHATGITLRRLDRDLTRVKQAIKRLQPVRAAAETETEADGNDSD